MVPLPGDTAADIAEELRPVPRAEWIPLVIYSDRARKLARTPAARHTLLILVLLMLTSKHGSCTASTLDVVAATGMDKVAAGESLGMLIRSGVLIRERRPFKASRYFLNIDALTDAGAAVDSRPVFNKNATPEERKHRVDDG